MPSGSRGSPRSLSPAGLALPGVTPLCFPPQDTVSWMPYLSITCVFSYVVGHALGPSTYPEPPRPPRELPA